MKLFKVILPAALCLFTVGGLATEARADSYDVYRRAHYARGRNSDEIRMRSILRDRLLDTASRLRHAERNRLVSSRDAKSMWRKLDYVHDFLRHDRNISRSEFNRRMDEIQDVERRLRRESRRDRYDRDDRRYDRYRR